MAELHQQNKALLSLGQVAKRIGCTYRHTRRLVACGDLRAIDVGLTKRGPTWRVEEIELRRFEQERRSVLKP